MMLAESGISSMQPNLFFYHSVLIDMRVVQYSPLVQVVKVLIQVVQLARPLQVLEW